MHVSVQIPKRNLSAQTPACYGEIYTQSSHKGWTSKAANRISCCFITLSLNQCHHMLLLAQDSAQWIPGRQALSKWATIISLCKKNKTNTKKLSSLLFCSASGLCQQLVAYNPTAIRYKATFNCCCCQMKLLFHFMWKKKVYSLCLIFFSGVLIKAAMLIVCFFLFFNLSLIFLF